MSSVSDERTASCETTSTAIRIVELGKKFPAPGKYYGAYVPLSRDSQSGSM